MYIVYKIINVLNHHYYIGVHKTNNINDSYLGSGIRILRAVRKYQKKNFIKQILLITDNKKEAYDREKELVKR
jgi:hypothetical protein